MRIAFFDSGIGGLTVLKEAVRELPDHEYLYYADSKNAPYGIKPKEAVRDFIFDAVEFLAAQGIDILVVACNTATSIAIADLRRRYTFPIIGMEPAVKPAILNGTGKKILVLATSLTLQESKLRSLIDCLDGHRCIIKLEMDLLVNFAEAFDFGSERVVRYIEQKLADFSWDEFETIVLGCTHFTYYRRLIRQIVGGRVALIDGNSGTVNHLKTIVSAFPQAKQLSGRNISFYSSGVRDDAARERMLLGLITEDA